MRWIPNGKYAIASPCGQYRISKAYLDGCSLYTLHHLETGEILKVDEDLEPLKELAQTHKEAQ